MKLFITCAAALFAVLTTSVSVADEGDYDLSGIEGYLVGLENEKKEKKEKKNKNKNMGASSMFISSDEESTGSQDTSEGQVTRSSKSNGDCDWIWSDMTHRASSWNYRPFVRIKVGLTIKTNTYKGSQTNPNTCFKGWYYSSALAHSGSILSHPGCNGCGAGVLVSIGEYYKENEAYLESYRSKSTYGREALPIRCAKSNHKRKIGSQWYSTNRTSGTCL